MRCTENDAGSSAGSENSSNPATMTPTPRRSSMPASAAVYVGYSRKYEGRGASESSM